MNMPLKNTKNIICIIVFLLFNHVSYAFSQEGLSSQDGLPGYVFGYVYDVMMPSTKISGAKVTVDGIPGDYITTSEGLYIIGPLPSGSYTLRASASGYGQGIGTVRVDGIKVSLLDIGLTGYPATVSGHVYITDDAIKLSIDGAIVGVNTDLNLLQNGQTIANTTTNTNGRYTIQLNQGDYYMRALKIMSSGAYTGTYTGYYKGTKSFHLNPGENKTGCDVTITK